MNKVISLIMCLTISAVIFAQNEKKEGDEMAAAGNYSGAVMMYRLCKEQDEECLLKLIRLLYEKKVEQQYTNELFQLVSPLAEKGIMEAQLYLAEMYFIGYDTQDYEKAFEWYTKSAEQGNADAQYQLGVMYQKGLGVKTDMDEALRWYRKSMAQGHASAQRSHDEIVNSSDEEAPNISGNTTILVTQPVENLRLTKASTNRSNLFFVAGGVSIAAGVAATILFPTSYRDEANGKITGGKEYNLIYAGAGLAIGGFCIGKGIQLKKKASVQPSNTGYYNNPAPSLSYHNHYARIDLIATGTGAGLRLTF